jgi:hypothetical protein
MAVVPIRDARSGRLLGFRGGATTYRPDGRSSRWAVLWGGAPPAADGPRWRRVTPRGGAERPRPGLAPRRPDAADSAAG